MTRRPAALLVLVALGACNAHVPLPLAPPANAPIEARADYYRRYRPVNGSPFGQMRLISSYGAWAPNTSAQLVLADGTLVTDPMDVVQMVGPDAPLAEAARRASSTQSLASGFTWGGVAASILGAVVMLSSFSSTTYDGSLGTAFWAGLGLGLAGSIATSVGRWGFATSAMSERSGVFLGLDAALRARMALCTDNSNALRDCNAPPAPPAPPAPSLPSPWAVPPPLPPAPPLGGAVSIHAR